MCLLIVSPAGTNIPEEHLDTAQEMNNDGYGWAIVAPHGIVMDKGMNYNAVKESWYKARAKYPNGDGMFHLRISTAGTVNTFNCHPFYVGNDERTVLAHNGVLPFDPSEFDPRSDTHLFAQDMLPQMLHGLDDAEWLVEFEKWVGHNKLAVLSVDPILKEYLYIINEHLGEWVEGVWYSNSYWKPYNSSYSRWARTPYGWDDDYRETLVSSPVRTNASNGFREIEGLDSMDWPSWSAVPLPANGYSYNTDEEHILSELGLHVGSCLFCEADYAFEVSAPDICWVCKMDPLENPRSRRQFTSTKGELVEIVERKAPTRLPALDSPAAGTQFHSSEGIFVYDGEAWQLFIPQADGDLQDFVQRMKDRPADRLLAAEPSDDVIFAQSDTDEQFLRDEESRDSDVSSIYISLD